MHIYIYRAEKGDEEDDGDVEGCGPFDWSGVVKRRKRVEREDVCAEVEGGRGREKERGTRNEKGLLFGGRERERRRLSKARVETVLLCRDNALGLV